MQSKHIFTQGVMDKVTVGQVNTELIHQRKKKISTSYMTKEDTASNFNLPPKRKDTNTRVADCVIGVETATNYKNDQYVAKKPL